MKKFELNVQWIEKCSATIDIVAENIEEALNLLKENKSHYLLLARNNAVSFRESSEIETVNLMSEEPVDNTIVDVVFCSQWDEGTETIETAAKFNTDTGEVFDIEPCQDDILERVTRLDSEYIILKSTNVKKYIFAMHNNPTKRITSEYILNQAKEAVIEYGNNTTIVWNHPNDWLEIRYNNRHDSFIYKDSIFEYLNVESINILIEALENEGYVIDEY